MKREIIFKAKVKRNNSEVDASSNAMVNRYLSEIKKQETDNGLVFLCYGGTKFKSARMLGRGEGRPKAY